MPDDVTVQIAELLTATRELNRKMDALGASNVERIDHVEERGARQDTVVAKLVAQIEVLTTNVSEMKTELAELNRLKNHGKGVFFVISGLVAVILVLFGKVDFHMPKMTFGG